MSKIVKYEYLHNNKIILYDDNKKIFIKNKKRYDLDKVYTYLDNHGIDNYLKPLRITDREIYFDYLDSLKLDKDEMAKRLIYNLSIWQNKTTIYRKIDKDKLKEEYDQYKNKIIYLENYYYTLQDMIESKVYMSSCEYLFIRNVSIIYKALNYSKNVLEEWYKLSLNETKERYVMCHGKCRLDHFISSDKDYFISLEKAHIGRVSEDFICFYNHHYDEIEMESSFRFYQHRYKYRKIEMLYLTFNLLMPDKIDIYPSSLDKSVELSAYFEKLDYTFLFVSEYQKDNHHNKEYEFN